MAHFSIQIRWRTNPCLLFFHLMQSAGSLDEVGLLLCCCFCCCCCSTKNVRVDDQVDTFTTFYSDGSANRQSGCALHIFTIRLRGPNTTQHALFLFQTGYRSDQFNPVVHRVVHLSVEHSTTADRRPFPNVITFSDHLLT